MATTMPPLAVPSSLVRTIPVRPAALLEGPGLDQAVLAGGGVQHQQGLPGGAGALPVDDLGELGKLRHEVCLVVEAAGGVAQHHVRAPGLGGLKGVEEHRAGVGPLVLAHQLTAGALRPDLQLVRRSGPEGVRGAQQHPLALALELMGQLADGRGLAHAVDADEQHHGGLRGQVQSRVPHGHLLRQDVPEGGLDLLLVLELSPSGPAPAAAPLRPGRCPCPGPPGSASPPAPQRRPRPPR